MTPKQVAGLLGACLIAFSTLFWIAPQVVHASDCTSTGSGDWNSPATWANCGGGIPGTADTATINSGHTVTLTADAQVAGITVNASGALNLGTYTLTVSGGSVTNNGTVNGLGEFRTSGTVTLMAGSLAFAPPLRVLAGVTTARGTLDGPATVAGGATLQVQASYTLTVHGNLIVDGALSGGNTISNLYLYGPTFTNNGTVSVADVYFSGISQTLQGAGSFNDNRASVGSDTTLTLGSDHRVSTVAVLGSDSTFDISGRTLSLSGAGTPLTINAADTFDTASSTIVYNGTAGQQIATANVDYHNLTVNNAAGVTLAGAEVVNNTLTLQNGVFSIGSNLTLGPGATIVRMAGSLSGTPIFGSSVNVIYNGPGDVITGAELPTATTVLDALTVSRASTVTLSQNQVVNGAFMLQAGTFAVSAYTLTLNNGATATGGSLTTAAASTVIYSQPSAGQAVLPGIYGNLTFSNHAKVLPSSGTVAIAGVFTPGTATGHTVTGSRVEFNGASAQILPSGFTPYHNLTLHNPAGVTGFSGLAVDGLLRVQQGTFTSASAYHDVQIDAGATLALSGDCTVTGDFTNSGALVANGHTVTFDGAGIQNLAANTATAFANLMVGSGVTLIETAAANNATVTGSLTNNGAIRKTQAIGGTGDVGFGLTGAQMNVATQGTLSSLQVDRIDSSSPYATAGVQTGRYWALLPNGGAGGYTVSLNLPHDGLADPTACRYTGVDWDCGRTSFTTSAVMRSSIAVLSDWTVGSGILDAVAPAVSISKSNSNIVLSWANIPADAEGYTV